MTMSDDCCKIILRNGHPWAPPMAFSVADSITVALYWCETHDMPRTSYGKCAIGHIKDAEMRAIKNIEDTQVR